MKKRGEFCVTPAFTPEPCGISEREWEGNDVLESRPAAPRAQFVVGVCALRTRADGGHVPVESTCRRDTSDTSGQQFSNGTKGSCDSLFALFFSLGIVCVCV